MAAARAVNTNWFKAELDRIGRSQRDLARELGISPAALSLTLRGRRNPKRGEISTIAKFLNVPLKSVLLAFGEIEGPAPPEKLTIMGYIGADGEVIVRDEYGPDGGIDEIDAPFPGYQGCAVRIRGDSMRPRFLDGEVLGYTPNGDDLKNYVGEEVIAKITDGRLVLKLLEKGSQPDKYTLVSLNPDVPPILDVELKWAALIDFHIPRRRRFR